ncbi:hypothetical protein CsatB_001055 [Cannabis sativa]
MSDNKKSTSGMVFTLGGGAVVLRSAKQTAISDSTTEAEYIVAAEAAKELVWLRKFFSGLGVVPGMEKPLVLLCDNTRAIANSKEPRSHKRSKHIERKYHIIREYVARGDVLVEKVDTKDNLTDPFTKVLAGTAFEKHRHNLGLIEMY